jgi:hypothetical protein
MVTHKDIKRAPEWKRGKGTWTKNQWYLNIYKSNRRIGTVVEWHGTNLNLTAQLGNSQYSVLIPGTIDTVTQKQLDTAWSDAMDNLLEEYFV